MTPLKLRYLPMLALVGLLAACTVSPPASREPTSSGSASAEPSHTEPGQAEPGFPAISAGEPWIATQPNHRPHLVLVRPDGSDPQDILTHLPFEQFHPVWSPDGSQLTFEHAPEGPDADVRDVWISDANGDNARPLLTKYPAHLAGLHWANPAWSPDGTAIAMVGYEGNASLELPARSILVIVEIASGEISGVSEYAQTSGYLHSFPRWSPDGKAFVFLLDHFRGEEYLGGAIAVIRQTDAGWSEPTLITAVGDWADRPDWHPTDDLIVFCTYDYGNFRQTEEPSNLFTIRPDGTELTQITTFGAREDRATQPSWTHDGRIIFTYVSGKAHDQQRPAFINVDGSGLEVLTQLENLVHSRLRPAP
jgi:Tol biopolymer transport system component